MRPKRSAVAGGPSGSRRAHRRRRFFTVLNELWAKVSAREKLVVYGAGLALLGVLIGLILASKSYGIAGYGISVNYFTADTPGLFVWLTLLAAVATLVVVYLHVAPNMKITWPMPYPQILLIAAGATAVCAVLVVLTQLTRPGGFGPEPPVFLYVADLAIVAGGVLAAYIAYMDWTASKAA
jgi:hypothetical protein